MVLYMFINISSKSDMTEVKAITSLILEDNTLSLDLLNTIINKHLFKELHTAATKLLDPMIAKRFFKAFEVGEPKVLFYGNPIVMSTKSKLFADLLEEAVNDTATTVLAPVEPYPEAFLSVWLYMNGITTTYQINHDLEPSVSGKEQRYKILGRMLRVWDWIKYFDLEKYDVFITYISTMAHDVWFYLLDIAPELRKGQIIESVKFPEEFLSHIQDLDEEIKSLAEDNIPSDAESMEINIRALFDFVLDRVKGFKLADIMIGTSHPFGYPDRYETRRLA